MSCSVVDRRSAMSGGNSMCRLRGSTASLSSPVSKTAAGGGSGPGSGPGSKQLNSGASPQGPSPTGPFRPTKPCCFCWCCCCSCSCLVKGVEDNGLTKNSNNADLLNCDGEPPPSIEEMRSWGKSFDKLMKSSAGRKVFRDFLRCEYSEENILFWLACEELKKESNPDAVEERARFIYEDYISILSPKEVSLDSRVREIVNRNMVEPTPHTFDEAQLQIYTLMHRDSYPRFVNSALYKTLAQIKNEEECVSGGTITGVGSSAISGGGGVDTSVSDGGVGNVSAGANSGAGANNGTVAISGACATNNEGNGSVSTTTKSTITATGGSTSATNDLPESPTAQHVSLVQPVTPTNRTSISPSSVKKQSSPLSQKSGNND